MEASWTLQAVAKEGYLVRVLIIKITISPLALKFIFGQTEQVDSHKAQDYKSGLLIYNTCTCIRIDIRTVCIKMCNGKCICQETR